MWAEELSSFIPGMRVGAIQVDTQSQPASSDGLTVPAPAAEPTETDIDKLLEDEAEEEAFRESRRKDEVGEAKRQLHHEHLCEIEKAHLAEEAAAYQAWEDSQIRQYLEEKMEHGGAKRRCVLQVEASSGSNDAMRLQHVFSMDVPDDGSSVSVTIKARMEQNPDDVETQLVPSPRPRDDDPEVLRSGGGVPVGESVEAQRGTIPDLLPHMEFDEYEQVYEKWRRGDMTMAELTKTYGAEAAELIQAQYALGCEVDAAASPEKPVKAEPAAATQLNGTGGGTTTVTSPTECGSTLVPFAIMQHVYRKWLDGSISATTLVQVYGQRWLEAFEIIRTSGLAAGRPLLEHSVRWDPCLVDDGGVPEGEFGGRDN